MGGTGFEPTPESPYTSEILGSDSAESSALGDEAAKRKRDSKSGGEAAAASSMPADLAEVVKVWPSLRGPIKAAVLALVRSVGK